MSKQSIISTSEKVHSIANEQETVEVNVPTSNDELSSNLDQESHHNETQFQGLIDLVNAKTEDLQKNVKESPQRLSETQEPLNQDAQDAIEKTYQEINQLVSQQKLLQTQQSSMHQELIDREKNLDKRERELLESSIKLERELRESERSRHNYEQKLQHLAEREALINYQSQELEETINERIKSTKLKYATERDNAVKEVEKRYAAEFQTRCLEAEEDFESRYAKLESRYQKKKSELLKKVQKKQAEVEAEIAEKVTVIEKALISKVEQQKLEAAQIISHEQGSLKEKESALQALFNQKLNDLNVLFIV